MGVYAIAWSFESNDIEVQVSHAHAETDTKSCDEMTECDNNCYDCCHCITLLQSNFDNSFNLQALNNFPYITSLNDLPAFLYKPPC
ncbi:MAG: hypothetical protein QM504_15460 [Pseudomonadota bacterium]